MTNLVHTDSYGVALIAEERQRQVDVEGFTPEHDADHAEQDLVEAAVCYALAYRSDDPPFAGDPAGIRWPWDASWWKPSDDPVRNLVKAGALIAAEVDRLRSIEVDRIQAAVAGDLHEPAPGNQDRCGSCDRDWHTDRCSRWCEVDPAGWCSDCRSAA